MGGGFHNRRRRNGQSEGQGMAIDSQPQEMPQVSIRNWEGGSVDDVVRFLQNKTRLQLRNPHLEGNVVVAQCRKQDVGVFERWNGARFAGRSLSLQVQKPAAPDSAVHLLENFLRSRYDPATQLLNLANMRGDPILTGAGLFSTPTRTSKMFQALMKLAGELLPGVRSVSLESNDMQDVTNVTQLSQTYPKLENLSLANNRITSTRGLSVWRNKFPLLRELVLAGNPLMPAQSAEVVAMFPRLLILDSVQVRSEAELPSNSLPVPMKLTFFENPEIQQMATAFLTNFFGLWDVNRDGLLQLYDALSEFSLCYNAATPRLSLANNTHTGRTGPYIAESRNLMRTSTANARHHRVALGPEAVKRVFNHIPRTKHDLSKPGAFAIDAWQVHDIRQQGDTGVLMSVHGEFVDQDTDFPRSFDRTLIVVPSPTGAMVIASDMLTVRSHSAMPQPDPQPNQPVPGPIPGAPVPGAPVPGAPVPGAPVPAPSALPGQPMPAPLQNQPPIQQAPQLNPGPGPEANVVQALMQQTRLNAHYAELCAKEANFDLGVAFSLFEQSRSNLPPDAFSG